jgi:hypothetical protein
MTKRHLFAEIKQGFDALSCAHKAEKNPNTTKVKLIAAPKLGAKKFHSIKESKAQGKGAKLAEGYKAMSQDITREQEAHEWVEKVVGDSISA